MYEVLTTLLAVLISLLLTMYIVNIIGVLGGEKSSY